MTRVSAPLTREQFAQDLRLIATYTAEHGRPPSMRELLRPMGLASLSGVHWHIVRLQLQGLIVRDPELARGISLTEAGYRIAGLPIPGSDRPLHSTDPDLPDHPWPLNSAVVRVSRYKGSIVFDVE